MSGFVYFIRPAGMLGPIKIGFSEAPTSRLETLAAWSPFRLEIVATIPGSRLLESSIHDCFGDDWSHREWFFPSRRLVEFVARIAAGVPIENAVDLNDKRGKRPRRGAEISREPRPLRRVVPPLRRLWHRGRPPDRARHTFDRQPRPVHRRPVVAAQGTVRAVRSTR